MLLIKNGTLYTMEGDEPFQADLLIRDGKIIEIAENIVTTEETEILDAGQMLVFPGFIDAHSHIGLAEEKLTPQASCRKPVFVSL